MSASFDDVLRLFKAKEVPEVIVQLTNDPKLCDALVAWPSVIVKRVPPKGEAPAIDNESELWGWLWGQVTYDQHTYACVANLRQQEVFSIIERLKGLRLIYPDGTIHVLARNFLRNQVAGKIKQNRPPKPATPPPGGTGT